jgi:UDP-N-acetylglucosamine--N-acetylmuramyl-(pentapeptide) pyrophosphoryl-undecaprenol N-acetylglucosamine transferase
VKNSTGVVIIAGGGTGGHIYPGIAIARAVEKAHPKLKVHFVGAKGGLEEQIVPREGFPLHLVSIGKLHRSVGLGTRVRTLLGMPKAFFSALSIIRELKPVAVLGVGGFASGPILFVSSLLGYRSLIWEPNAYPGLANRWLSRLVDECLVVFKEASRFLSNRKITQSGLPVRAAMKPASRLNPNASLHVLVFGGSQGARFINDLVVQALRTGDGWLEGIELVHQTGSGDFERIKKLYENAPERFQVFPYLHDMSDRYHWADLVICRSGASTVAEISATLKAAIFIPLPTAADDHQAKNARVLEKSGAAVVMLQKDLTPEKLRGELIRYRDDRSQIQKLEKNIAQFQFPDAAEKIVERLLDLQ